MKSLSLVALLVAVTACGSSPSSPAMTSPTPTSTTFVATPGQNPIVTVVVVPSINPVHNQTLTFHLGVADGVVTSAVLNFGDGSQPQVVTFSGQEATVSHVYEGAGPYVVTLTVNGGAVVSQTNLQLM